MINKKFKMNIERYNRFKQMIGEHSLTIQLGVVFDTSLPIAMHRIVCEVDTKQIDLDKPLELSQYPEITDYLNGGREKRINEHNESQKAAHEWANRPVVKY